MSVNSDTVQQSASINQKIVEYLQLHCKNQEIHLGMQLKELGFESIDYIQFATYLFNETKQWLDISKLDEEKPLSALGSCLSDTNPCAVNLKESIKLDRLKARGYAAQINGEESNRVSYVVHFLALQEHVDLNRLKSAIIDTLNNHFILNSKLTCVNDEYYLIAAERQSDIWFKGSFFFPKKDINSLAITVHSPRLANIYLQKKKGHSFLIISFHHIIMDGWSHKLVQEEIFRRYAGLPVEQNNISKDFISLNNIYPVSMNEPSNTKELKAVFNAIKPGHYRNFDCLFEKKTETKYCNLVISKEEMDDYAEKNNIQGYPYSTIFSFMMYHMVRQLSGHDKLLLYISLSNRFLPIPGVVELVGNMVTGLPLFLDENQMSSQDFAAHIDKLLQLYFKHMSYGAVVRLLMEGDALLNKYISPFTTPYYILLTFTNNVTKMVYKEDPITGNYVYWNKSKCYLHDKNKRLFCDVHDMGSEFYVHFHTRMKKGMYHSMLSNFLAIHFPKAYALMKE
ncbi:condensation domain-containing protein [Legionella shakespearei]|uniref:Linear gramicidin synthase subunit D n=1 Tax=Legionella shakespearei DSM 23087 TaxID=1122169 RepID=A0A0W0YUX1_9GAMM|nr:condensation domain-containing protein [Legionella shakespearei]KTD60704.1 Linear gramicidin synthase subunit D [Legionella shakespearei DSM 23087]